MKTVLCSLFFSLPRNRLLPAACCLLAIPLAGCDRASKKVVEVPLNVPPGAYDTHSERTKIVVSQDGKAVLLRDGNEVSHRVEKRGDAMVVVAADNGEVFKPLLSSGVPAPAHTAPVHGAASLQYEQNRQEWERQRAEMMKKAEGARQHAQQMLKEARAKAAATTEKQ